MSSESITEVVVVLAACAAAWGLWRAGRPRAVFRVRVAAGRPEATEGTVTPAFLTRVREVAAANGVSRGVVSGFAHGEFIRLRFSAEIPEPARQQLRNWWASSGWPALRSHETHRCG
jgi:hypothetical protein